MKSSDSGLVDQWPAILWQTLEAIPPGFCISYGDLAERAGRPGYARGTARYLAKCPDHLPWWRVVGSGHTLRLNGPAGSLQRDRLIEEGWMIRGNRLYHGGSC